MEIKEKKCTLCKKDYITYDTELCESCKEKISLNHMVIIVCVNCNKICGMVKDTTNQLQKVLYTNGCMECGKRKNSLPRGLFETEELAKKAVISSKNNA